MEQRTMMLLIAPRPAVMQKVQQQRAAAAKALRERGEDREQEQRDDAIAKLEQQLADQEEADEAEDGDDE
jgi:translation initiation factor IF-3